MVCVSAARKISPHTGCLSASNTILIGADQKETFEFCPPTEDTYLPSGDFELDFRVGLSSWIFELDSRVGFLSSTITNIDIDIDYIINCISCLITNNCVIFFCYSLLRKEVFNLTEGGGGGGAATLKP